MGRLHSARSEPSLRSPPVRAAQPDVSEGRRGLT